MTALFLAAAVLGVMAQTSAGQSRGDGGTVPLSPPGAATGLVTGSMHGGEDTIGANMTDNDAVRETPEISEMGSDDTIGASAPRGPTTTGVTAGDL